ncbi:MAG TPA: NAD(P)H-dependent oxidoreductase [Candidatus Saccharimonadales bacterium]|nr:NAD(P)H-dependent oxidoreductase [Candidatus Saccharimonadales bacterium]
MKIAVILGTNCDNRLSEQLAQGVAEEAGGMEGTNVDLIDLKEYSLSIFDDAASSCPYQSKHATRTAQEWLDKIEKADAYVFVTPDIDHTIPSVLKNAFDYVTREMDEKPAAIVSYGGVGGSKAVARMKDAIGELRAVPIPAHVAISDVDDTVNDSESLATQIIEHELDQHAAMKRMLRELRRYRDVLTATGAYA